MVTRGHEEGQRERLLDKYGAFFGDKNILESDEGGSCIIVRMYYFPLNCSLRHSYFYVM